MKKLFNTLVVATVLFSFSLVVKTNEASAATYPSTKATVKAGDILVTKTTNCKPVCKGLSGHSSIVIDSTYAVHIAGPKSHPAKIKITSWFKKYKSTKIVRTTSKYRGNPKDAAKWAANYVKKYPKAKYDITPNRGPTNETLKTYAKELFRKS